MEERRERNMELEHKSHIDMAQEQSQLGKGEQVIVAFTRQELARDREHSKLIKDLKGPYGIYDQP